jgi:hypothetical protein
MIKKIQIAAIIWDVFGAPSVGNFHVAIFNGSNHQKSLVGGDWNHGIFMTIH